jgi:hypothetical protein
LIPKEENLPEFIAATQHELDLCGIPSQDHGRSLSIAERVRMLRRRIRLDRFTWYEGDFTVRDATPEEIAADEKSKKVSGTHNLDSTDNAD